MSESIVKLIEQNNENGIHLIVDLEDYAQKLFLQSKPTPWHDATAYANYLRQAVALLKPDVAIVRIDKMLAQELINNDELLRQMGEKTRKNYALKTMMANEELREAVVNIVSSCVKVISIPLLIQLPSPFSIMVMTSRSVAQDHEFNEDDAENAAMYYADWLRAMKDIQIGGLIFDEREQEIGENAYQPITNMAQHYSWPYAVRRHSVLKFYQPKAEIGVLSQDYWIHQQDKNGLKGIVLSTIHQDAIPEDVLDLRQALNAE